MLKGTKIIDLSRIIVGPYATMILSDFGCNVIKVQAPQGDPTRQWGPPWALQTQQTQYSSKINSNQKQQQRNIKTSAYFLSINRNKKSIILDFKNHKHKNILYQLVSKADVVVQNFVPGVTQKLKIDYQTLKKYNQKIVYCSISGYGDFGPLKNTPCFDNAIQAQAGFMHLTGNPGSQPFKMGFAITDVLTGLYASNSILAGLHYRNQNQKSIHLKTSLYECALASLINQSSNYLNGKIDPNRSGNHHPSIVPYGLYQTNDSSIIICVGTQGQYQRLIQILKITQKYSKQLLEKFNSNSKRVQNRKQFDLILKKSLKQFPSSNTQEIVEIFRKNDIPCSKVNSISEALQSPLTNALKIVKNVNGYKCVRSPIRYNNQSQENNLISQPVKPPRLNQSYSEILAEIGFSSQKIEQYVKSLKK